MPAPLPRWQPARTVVRLLGPIVGAGVFFACAAAPGPTSTSAAPEHATATPPRTPRPPRRPPVVYTPGTAGASSYESPPLSGEARRGRTRRDPEAPPIGELEAGLLKLVTAAALEAKVPPPVPDPRLHAIAADLAKSARGMNPPPSDVVRFFANHQGVIEPDPAIYTLTGPANIPGVHEQYRRSLGRIFKRGAWNRVGVASLRRGDQMTVVLTMWEQQVELAPVPRALPSEGRAAINVRLLGSFAKPQIVVTLPTGNVRALVHTQKDGRLQAELRCFVGDGRYQVEILASGAAGPLVLGNFPVFCGVRPPDDISAYDEDDPEDIDPADAEQEILALINHDRQAAGVPALVWDNRLAAIARAHSRDMLTNGFVAHVSPTTGDALARVSRAGLAFPLVVENVGQEGGVHQAHRGFMASPGHRANVLNPKVTHVGIGVVVRKSGGAPLFVTELFAAQ